MILIHIDLVLESCENWFAPVFPDPSSDAHLLTTSPRPVRSCPDPQTSRPSATPCRPLAVRTCTTSLHKETCSCCSSRFPSLQRLKNAIGISVLCCNHLPLPQVQSKCQQRPFSALQHQSRNVSKITAKVFGSSSICFPPRADSFLDDLRPE